MDDTPGALTPGLSCASCGTGLAATAKFCSECGAPRAEAARSAEYKQVTVLFADVVRSMDIATRVGAERLREIMTDLVERSTAVVRRYGGTVDKFTGDGLMAVFGAPAALEDHAIRACLAALGIQAAAATLSEEVRARDGITLQLRVGLNSGQVIAGEIGSGAGSYTAIGEQVGMAQRMESVAAPGAVMVSESTARLIGHVAVLGEPQEAQVKGTDRPVPTWRLIAVDDRHARRRGESKLVGRAWELNTVAAILDEAIGGSGCVVSFVGPPGIGKSRMVREAAAVAVDRGVPVFNAHCESHASDVPFHAVAGLLRAALGIEDLDADKARRQVGELFAQADAEDLVLLHDLLGVREAPLPDVAPDARRRRVTSLINGAALERQEPGVYVIEDVHWIDEASESMLAGFLAIIPQTPTLVLLTYRPEYQGRLTRLSGVQSLALRPLNDAHTSALTAQLLGNDPSTRALAQLIATRAAGNPFFAEEIVRDLSERAVLQGDTGNYRLADSLLERTDEVAVPATLQATIGARIDRLSPTAKRTLNAAAVIGSRFDVDLLDELAEDADPAALIDAELIDQVRFTPKTQYAFRHPLIHAVAYESQLKADRAKLHRRLAAAIEARGSVDENAALIAEHMEGAGDLPAAFAWHMRAGAWTNYRDIAAAHSSWRRALRVADRLPEDHTDRMSMRIAPRMFLCATASRQGGRSAETGFDELRHLCNAAGDQRSLAVGMVGPMTDSLMNVRREEASRLADEQVRLLESIGDPTLTLGLLSMALLVKHEMAEMAEILRLSQHVIDLADGDFTKGNLVFGSPLTYCLPMRGVARACLGLTGWREDFQRAMAAARHADAMSRASAVYYTYMSALTFGLVLPDDTVLAHSAGNYELARQAGEDIAESLSETVQGVVLASRGGADRAAGIELLVRARERALELQFTLVIPPFVDSYIARDWASRGDVDGAIELARTAFADMATAKRCVWLPLAVTALVEALVKRGADQDLDDAKVAIDRLAAAPTDPGYVVNDVALLRLRALLAQAHGDAESYRDYRDRYRAMAKSLGFQGHMALARAMA
ncbi:adenylate/guanylate cyclase domain-containing protein [Mycobacterium alsense]|uniref:adenylate/guanylate cyclase domain-containing protein n=1 Tax=Mycobacterium alsense TaxID=324058 RepID=UPI000A5BE950|nr:adenylate/guanylate cyclase domain-containing protein [Mycobacterium alsense]